ncbi:hypothetical protein ACWKWU_15015 [Chitinophaga lutea]
MNTRFLQRKLSLLLLAAPLCVLSAFTNKADAPAANASKAGGKFSVQVTSPYFYTSRIFRPNMLMVNRGLQPEKLEALRDGLSIDSDLAWLGDACPYYHYHCQATGPYYGHVWYPMNCTITTYYSSSHIIVMMNSGLIADGWASIGVEAQDGYGNTDYYEISVNRSFICDDPE